MQVSSIRFFRVSLLCYHSQIQLRPSRIAGSGSIMRAGQSGRRNLEKKPQARLVELTVARDVQRSSKARFISQYDETGARRKLSF